MKTKNEGAFFSGGRSNHVSPHKTTMSVPKPIRLAFDDKFIFVHGSRSCTNCASRDETTCFNGIWHGFPHDVIVCPEHVTVHEDRKNLHQPHRPPLFLVCGAHPIK